MNEHARRIANDLLAKLKAGELEKIGIDEIQAAMNRETFDWDRDAFEHAICRYVVMGVG